MKSLIKRKKYKNYYMRIRSRHPSHNAFRKKILLPFKSVLRLGSTTPCNDVDIEINNFKVASISGNKKLMKEAFVNANVKHANFFNNVYNENNLLDWANEKYPIICKQIHSSRGRGNFKINDEKEFKSFLVNKNLNNYIFEKFYNYNKEYRLHVTTEGCFYTCRKMLKNEFKNNKNSWQRHDDNSVWIVEENPNFEKPSCWTDIVEDCIKVLNIINADILCFDVRVQNELFEGKKRKEVNYILIECNSAPGMAEKVLNKYLEILPKLAKNKYNNGKN